MMLPREFSVLTCQCPGKRAAQKSSFLGQGEAMDDCPEQPADQRRRPKKP